MQAAVPAAAVPCRAIFFFSGPLQGTQATSVVTGRLHVKYSWRLSACEQIGWATLYVMGLAGFCSTSWQNITIVPHLLGKAIASWLKNDIFCGATSPG